MRKKRMLWKNPSNVRRISRPHAKKYHLKCSPLYERDEGSYLFSLLFPPFCAPERFSTLFSIQKGYSKGLSEETGGGGSVALTNWRPFWWMQCLEFLFLCSQNTLISKIVNNYFEQSFMLLFNLSFYRLRINVLVK